MRPLKPSPVRGQLDPPDERERTGWRFLQCTETPDEYKVLLPPRTVLFYQELLKSEVRELGQENHIQWQRIIYIRYLKDRMIKKCKRLCGWKPPSKPAVAAFLSVHAPPDFRLYEMEQWCREQRSGSSERHYSPVDRKYRGHSLRPVEHAGSNTQVAEVVQVPELKNREALSDISRRSNSEDQQYPPAASNDSSCSSCSCSECCSNPYCSGQENEKDLGNQHHTSEDITHKSQTDSVVITDNQYQESRNMPPSPASPQPLPVRSPISLEGTRQDSDDHDRSPPIVHHSFEPNYMPFRMTSPQPLPMRPPETLHMPSGSESISGPSSTGYANMHSLTNPDGNIWYRYPLSRGSSISDPVIPDPSLLEDAVRLRQQTPTLPRRRGRPPLHSGASSSSSSSGHSSGTSSLRRLPSRPSTPMRPGILKRSDSQSSQRKSVSFAQPDGTPDIVERMKQAEAAYKQACIECEQAKKECDDLPDGPQDLIDKAIERSRISEANMVEKERLYHETVDAYNELLRT